MSEHEEANFLMSKSELSEFVCDLCGKFLSVKPVRSWLVPTKCCARCNKTKSKDGIRFLDLLIEKYVFPCFNMLDGCKKLLKPDEVAEHEAACKSTQCTCPICHEESIALYKLPKHYKEKHNGNLLRSKIFFTDLGDGVQRRWFLYEHGTRLFCIEIQRTEEGAYKVFAEYLGAVDVNEVITQQFSVCFGNEVYLTKRVQCYPEHSTDVDTLEAIKVGCFQQVVVSVSLDVPLYPGLTTSQDGVVTRRSASLIIGDWDYSESYLIQPRKLYLPRVLERRFAFHPRPCFMGEDASLYYPYCYYCGSLSYITYRASTAKNVFFYRVGEGEYALCSYCLWIPNPQPLKVSTVKVQERHFKWIRYSCIWNCVYLGGCDAIEEHHIKCNNQPSRFCPTESCKFVGKLYELEEHFATEHPNICLSLSSSVLPKFDEFGPDEYILLVKDAFVRLEVEVCEDSFRVKFSLCGDKCRYADKTLKALVSDALTKIYVDSCVYPEELFVKVRESLRICCYFS